MMRSASWIASDELSRLMDPSLRRSIYSLMLVAAAGMMVARVVNVEFLYEPSLYKAYPKRNWPSEKPAPQPSFGSNDRARWATVKAIVEDETYVIGRRSGFPSKNKPYTDTGVLFQPGFGSVDVVLDPEDQTFYSTKPPLLTEIAAGEYWILHHVFKKNISEHRWETVVPILLMTNVLPLLIALWLLSRLFEWYGKSDWGRLFVFATACFGTFLPTFASTLNNHVPAACCVMYALYAMLAPVRKFRSTEIGVAGSLESLRDPVRLLQVGLFTGFAASMDLPAAALGGIAALLVLRSSWKGLLLFLPAFAIPIAVQTFINYQMVDTWKPIYSKFGTEWYEYIDSHWAKRKLANPEGIDFANESKDVYAFHLLFGHHGLFSLSPVWLIALVGMGMSFSRELLAKLLHYAAFVILLVVVVFYILKTNNYGGWTSGPRWFFWLTPLFLLTLLPAADWLGRWKVGRVFAYLCLAISAFSATYPWANPWRHPWIYQWCEYMDILKY
jgi:hypothetical protein